jgi:hypothetical protein
MILLSPVIEAWSGEHAPGHLATIASVKLPGDRNPASINFPKHHGSQVQMVANYQTPLAYFIDQLPADFEAAKLPSDATDIVIAKVRAVERPVSLGDRDRSHPADIRRSDPADIRRDLLFIRIRILDVQRGNATIGKEYDIYFGEPGRDLIYPATPEQLNLDYTVMMYVDSKDAKRRLVAFPIGAARYLDWQSEVFKYERSQYKN